MRRADEDTFWKMISPRATWEPECLAAATKGDRRHLAAVTGECECPLPRMRTGALVCLSVWVRSTVKCQVAQVAQVARNVTKPIPNKETRLLDAG